jgi:excisionase family DNA binding protein
VGDVVHIGAYLTKAQLAQELQMSERWIELQVRDHGLPSIQFGRSRRFKLADVEAWAMRRAS